MEEEATGDAATEVKAEAGLEAKAEGAAAKGPDGTAQETDEVRLPPCQSGRALPCSIQLFSLHSSWCAQGLVSNYIQCAHGFGVQSKPCAAFLQHCIPALLCSCSEGSLAKICHG